MKIFGRLVDIHDRDIYDACIETDNGRIKRIERSDIISGRYILPGLIDAHIHIESSMVSPGAFAVAAVRHGTVAVVSDPHEIANVCGIEGVEFMIEDASRVPLKFFFGAPSCVPATSFETSGGKLDKGDVDALLKRGDIHYLSEMMNFPGVINGVEDVISKIESAKVYGKPVDGHAPGIKGDALKKYVQAGITTDHECSSLEEAREKISLGVKIIIREGSAAKNLENIKELFKSDPEMIMLCSDDLHPEMLLNGHINKLVARLVSDGYDVFDVIRSTTMNPVLHYKLDVGLLRTGDHADFVVVDNLKKMNVLETWINGEKVFEKDKVYFEPDQSKTINTFNCSFINREDILVKNRGDRFRIIEAMDGELFTKAVLALSGNGETVIQDIERDYLKVVVKDRYNDSPPAAGFIKGFNLKRGAFASSVAHDSHNIICVGANDDDMVSAINAIVEMKGGLSVASGNKISSLQLNIGGIMTSNSCLETAAGYYHLTRLVKEMGCTLSAPFMTMAFMALLVIPDLKISDRGLFDVRNFRPVPLFI